MKMRHVFPWHFALFIRWCNVHSAGARKRAIVEDRPSPFRELTQVKPGVTPRGGARLQSEISLREKKGGALRVCSAALWVAWDE